MKVTVKVELDDGQQMRYFAEIDSAGNPRFWSQGFMIASQEASDAVRRMMETTYGTSQYQGIHIAK